MKHQILSRIASHIQIRGAELAAFEALSKCAEVDPHLTHNALTKTACVVAAGTWAGSRCLIKNRDRNYDPRIVLYHEVIDGTEVLYMKDLETGWIEGMNEHGIGIVNSALMVARDEEEKKRAKKGEPTKDGNFMLKALSMDSAKDVSKYLRSKDTRLLGHTLIASTESIRTLEQTSKHTCIERETSKDVVIVRTNHGWHHEGAGYQTGDDYMSTLVRRENAQRVLEDEDLNPEDLAPALYNHEYRKKEFNIVRDAKLYTSSQMVLDLTKKVVRFYLIPGKQKFIGVVNNMGKRKPKISLEVFEFDRSGKAKAFVYDDIDASEVPEE